MTIQEQINDIRRQEMFAKSLCNKDRLATARWLSGLLEQLPKQPVDDNVADKLLRGLIADASALTLSEIEFISNLLPKLLTVAEISDTIDAHKAEIKAAGKLGPAMGVAKKLLEKAFEGKKYSGGDLKVLVEEVLNG